MRMGERCVNFVKFCRCTHTRPLVFICLCFILGLLLSRVESVSLYSWTGLFLCLFIGVWCWLRWPKSALLCLGLLFVGIGFLRGLLAFSFSLPQPPAQGTLQGTMVDQPVELSRGRLRIILERVQMDGVSLPYRTQVTILTGLEQTPQAGDMVICPRAKLEIPPEADAGSTYNERLYLQGKSVYYQAVAAEAEVRPSPPALRHIPARIAAWMKTQIADLYPLQAGTVTGMLMGDKSALADDSLEAFRVSGVSHVLAVSGLHVGFVSAAFLYVLRKCKRKRWWQILLVLSGLWLYCAMVGFPASAVRACCMTTLALLAQARGERYDLLTALAISAFVILFFAPAQLFAAGFLLSFGAMLGIAALCGPIEKGLCFLPQWLRTSLALSISAQMGVWPIGSYLFGTIQLYGLITNLAVVPLASVITVGGLVSCLLSPLGILAQGIAWVVEGLAALMETIVLFVASWPGAQLLYTVTPWQIGCWAAGVFLLSVYCLWPAKVRWSLAFVCFVLAIFL